MVRMLSLALLLAVTATASAYPEHWPRPNLEQPPTPSGHPEVLFTFDDGPHERHTGKILDTLRTHGVQAIFYWVGYRVRYRSADQRVRQDLVRRAVAERHLIGNHTVNHARLCDVSLPQATREIDTNRETYEALTGLPMVLFRAPYGDRCPRLERMLDDRRIRHHHWDIDPQEWDKLDSEVAADEIIDQLERLRGRAIILLHDTHYSTVKVLPIILHWIRIENAEREQLGKKTIKILSASEYVAEKMDVSLFDWARRQLDDSARDLGVRVGRLVPGPNAAAGGPRVVVTGERSSKHN